MGKIRQFFGRGREGITYSSHDVSSADLYKETNGSYRRSNAKKFPYVLNKKFILENGEPVKEQAELWKVVREMLSPGDVVAHRRQEVDLSTFYLRRTTRVPWGKQTFKVAPEFMQTNYNMRDWEQDRTVRKRKGKVPEGTIVTHQSVRNKDTREKEDKITLHIPQHQK